MNRKERRAQKKLGKSQQSSGIATDGVKVEDAVPPATGAAALVSKEAIEATRALIDNGYYPEAKELFEILMELAPENFPLMKAYAQALFLNEDIFKAHQIFEKMLKIQPGSEDAFAGLAACSNYMEDSKNTQTYLSQLEGRDLNFTTLNQIATIYNVMGNFDKAMECLEESIRKQPLQIAGYYELQNMKKFTPDDPHIAHLKKVDKAQNTLSERDRIMLNFTLGKVYLDLGDADKGYEHYAVANKLKKLSLKIDKIEMLENYVDSIINLFNEDFVKKFKNAGTITSERPIFIVGMPRSGSTLTDQILSAHPDVASFGEKSLFPRSVPVVFNTEVPGMGVSHTTGKPVSPTITKVLLDAVTPEALDTMGNNYLKKTDPFAKNGVKRVVDKMLFNHLWVGLIRLTLPHAKIIHCVRDPVDIGHSIWKLWFAGNMPWAYDLTEIGRYYNAYKKLMDHWHKLFPGEIYEARYEDMVADQEGQSRRLLEFCGLSWNDDVLNFHESGRSVKTASVLQVRKPIYKDSVKKWKKYEKYLKPLIDEVEKSGEY